MNTPGCYSREQREAEVISGFLKYPFWNRTKSLFNVRIIHSLAISKLVSIVTESGQKLIQVCRHPPVGLRLKRKRGVRRMNDSNNEDYDDDDYSLAACLVTNSTEEQEALKLIRDLQIQAGCHR